MAKTAPKDVLLQLASALTLYLSASSILILLYQFVNYFFPDPVRSFGPGISMGAMRWAIASLIVIFPAHIFIARLLFRDLKSEPERREGRLRRWVLYFTLFAAAAALLGDLIALIYKFLEGELTARFILQILSVAAVAGGVFWYYLWDLRRSPAIDRETKTIFRAISGLVALVVFSSFFVIGSPFAERARRIDAQRVDHLRTLQGQIVFNYWQPKGELPPSLDVLRNEISGFVPPRDPETGEPYEYRVTGPLSFELCAIFNSPSDGDPFRGMYYSQAFPSPDPDFEIWNHGAGRVCFERTIDPDLYGKGQGLEIPRKF